MRQNEYLADEFAYKIGFGLELATVLDQHISDVPHDGFLSAIYADGLTADTQGCSPSVRFCPENPL